MKPIIILFALLFAAIASYAQQVVANSGNTGSAAGYTVDWTLGEPAIETFTGTNNILTQGFHQTQLVITALKENLYPGLEVKAYPNPTGNFLKIEVIQPGNEEFQYVLTDIEGRKVMKKKRFTDAEDINMSSYVPGIYMVIVSNSKQERVKIFKIVKN